MTTGTTTVGQVFTARGLVQWWTMRPSRAFGVKGEQGQDYSMPLNTPIGSVSSGRVIYAGPMQSNPGASTGYAVVIEHSDGSIIRYHHLRTANVQVGQYVHVGDVLGLSGGCPANGYGTTGCTRIDQYSDGPHIEVAYAPSYNPSQGIWHQQFTAPQTAFNFFAGAQVLGDLSSLLAGQAKGCQHAVQLPGGLSICMDAGEDLFIRSGFVVGGAVLVTLAILLFVWNAAQPAANQAAEAFLGSATSAAGGVVGSRSAEKALDQKPLRRPEKAEASLPAIPAPAPVKKAKKAKKPATAAAEVAPGMRPGAVPPGASADEVMAGLTAEPSIKSPRAAERHGREVSALDRVLQSLREPNAGLSAIDRLRIVDAAPGKPEGRPRELGAGGENRRKQQRQRRAEKKNRPPNVTDLRAPRRARRNPARSRKRNNVTDLPPAAEMNG